MKTIRLLWYLCIMLQALCFSASLWAQSATSSLSGRITDPRGEAVPKTLIEAIENSTNARTTTLTNDDGLYYLPSLRPGTYRVVVSKDGFKQVVQADVLLHVQDVLTLNFSLQIGTVSETVTVNAGVANINTSDASVSTVIDRGFVENLPLNGRSFNTLLQLTPGVVIAPIPRGGFSQGQFSIVGQRADSNNFLVDGVSANFGVSGTLSTGSTGTGQAQAFSVLGGTSSLVSVDALEEFRIETSSFAPEFGRNPGGQVILTTRSGTNDFHGGVFDYFRNTVLDANDWFTNASGQPRAAEHHNDFGGFVGGPILKDNTFFFFSYEGARLIVPGSQVLEVPSVSARTSAPSALAPFLNAYPEPNGPISPDGFTAQYTAVYDNTSTLNASSIRLDHTFNDRFSIFGRYDYAPSQAKEPIGAGFEVDNPITNTQTLTVGLNMLLSHGLTNTLRANYSNQSSAFKFLPLTLDGAVPLNPSLILDTLPASENEAFFFSGDTAGYFLGPNGQNRARQFNLVDDVSVSAGAHQLKFGADYRAIFLDVRGFQNSVEFDTPGTIQQFLASDGAGSLFLQTRLPAQLLFNALSLYAQDTWRATPRLTLTYGLRWELSPPPAARGNTVLSAWENVNTPAEIALAPTGTPLWKTTYANFAPRFGLAYQLNQHGDFVVRAGAGIFYDLSASETANLASAFPNSAVASLDGSVPVTSVSSILPTISLNPPYDNVYGYAPNLVLPRSYQWNVALEKSFGGRQVVSATYLGQAGRDLFRQEGLFEPNPNFASVFRLTLNDARSNYNALQLQYRRPLSRRLQALLNYTWSHSLDSASNDTVVGVSNTVVSSANDYASSDFDVRQSFSGAFTYSIPSAAKIGFLANLTKDWSLDGVVVARSGFPFDAVVLLGGSLSGFTRADLVPGQPLWLSAPSAPGGKMLNGSAFLVPSTIRQGTEGRNIIPGLGLTQVDLSFERKFALTERVSLQFRTDAFNLLNHPNFTNPPAAIQFGPSELRSREMLNQGLGGLNPLFQEGGPRSLQLSLKLTF